MPGALVFQLAGHLGHGGVRDGLVQTAVLLHPTDVQVLDGDGLALAHRIRRGLVDGILALVGYPLMDERYLPLLLLPSLGPLLLAGQAPLLPGELPLAFGKRLGVCNLDAI